MKTMVSKEFGAEPFPRSLLLDQPAKAKSEGANRGPQHGRSPQEPGVEELQPLNLKELEHRCMGRSEFAERLLESFETRFPIEAAEIAGSVAKKDGERSARLVHQLKGTTANICAPALNRILQQMESSVRGEQFGEVERLLMDLDREWQRFAAYRQSQVITH